MIDFQERKQQYETFKFTITNFIHLCINLILFGCRFSKLSLLSILLIKIIKSSFLYFFSIFDELDSMEQEVSSQVSSRHNHFPLIPSLKNCIFKPNNSRISILKGKSRNIHDLYISLDIVKSQYQTPCVYILIQGLDKIAYLIQDTLLSSENCQISSKERGIGILYAGAYLLSRLTNSDLYSQLS